MDRITGIKAITFDLDGTLWDYDTVMRRSMAYALDVFALSVAIRLFLRLRQSRSGTGPRPALARMLESP